MFFIIIILIFIYFLLYKNNNESFTDIEDDDLKLLIQNKINDSEFNDKNLPIDNILNFFKNIYQSSLNYNCARIIFNNRQIFNRFFILKKQELNNNIQKINNLLNNDGEYENISQEFWNVTYFKDENFKYFIDNISNNTSFLEDSINKRKFILSNDSLRILFKSILDELEPIILNS